MASAALTLAGSAAREIECDTTERLNTLRRSGGKIRNKSANSVWVNTNGGVVDATNGSESSVEVVQNQEYDLPLDCATFRSKTAAGTSYLVYTPRA